MEISSAYNNQTDIQSMLLNSINTANRTNSNDYTNKTAYYAQKGEPMYMAEMDLDEDGTVTLDEFREYCKSKGISSRDMLNMSKSASSYRIMKSEAESIDYISKLIPNVFPKLKQSESGNLKQSENQYNISNDSTNKVSYQEYMDYCKHNAVQNELKTNTKIEDSNDGFLKISNSGKAVEAYKINENSFVKSTFEKAV